MLSLKLLGAISSLFFVRLFAASSPISGEHETLFSMIDYFGVIGVLLIAIYWLQNDRRKLVELVESERRKNEEQQKERFVEYQEFVREQTEAITANTDALKEVAAQVASGSCPYPMPGPIHRKTGPVSLHPDGQ